MNDIMIDIETLGIGSDAVVLSIGAVVFDPSKPTLGATFYKKLKTQPQLDTGRKIQEQTLKWWLSQDKLVFEDAMKDQEPVKHVLTELHKFISGNIPDRKKRKVWGNGATFDIVILESLFKDFNEGIPWGYSGAMDLRTFKRFVGKGEDIPTRGNKHSALDDAISQADYVIQKMKNFA